MPPESRPSTQNYLERPATTGLSNGYPGILSTGAVLPGISEDIGDFMLLDSVVVDMRK